MTRPGLVACLGGLALGAVAGRTAFAAVTRGRTPKDTGVWSRTNHRGEHVTLLEGPAYSLAAAAAAGLAPGVPSRLRVAAALAALGTGAVGAYDDLLGSTHVRGFKGHLGALRQGRVTSGTVKLVGVAATAVAAAAAVNDARAKPVDTVLAGGVIAGSANLVNLLDLRPGRAIKAGLIVGVPALLRGGAAATVAGTSLGAAAALLPEDLCERAMLGDAGAHALGALLGVVAVEQLPRGGQLGLLGMIVGLTAASEMVSFTKVIESAGPLRWVDGLGRRPPPSG